ncbi:Hypothetical protein, putative [Bodo saltans]|uniref:Uncharacterized protein n=1 Tax=Bodo saltans TaxID=75058 RepID=A0A0S4J070_BODSA|nr:Hypothetical protein, putative [Bodo saltans]|eukprot:CUG29115.1 Hypothetical protein, putative [Bodo saltans]
MIIEPTNTATTRSNHALQCASRGCKYRRHNLRDMLDKAAQGVGLQPVLEPSHLCTDEKRHALLLLAEGTCEAAVPASLQFHYALFEVDAGALHAN